MLSVSGKRAIAIAVFVAAFLAAAPGARAEDRAKDVIVARKTLMNSIMDQMDRIAEMISQGKIDLRDAHASADTASVMLMAFPHLFPPESNQWKENVDRDPATDTVAAPEIWIDFADFYRRAALAAKTAYEVSRADNEDEIKRLNRALGNACDTCHAMYLKE
jgi:cytochrome c556